MGLLNKLPLPPGIDETTLAGSQVQEIVTAYNIESLEAVNQPVGKQFLWASRGTRVTPGIGRVKVPIRFLGNQMFTDFEFGGQRDYSTMDVGAIEIHTRPKQLNYRWAMVADALGKLNLMTVKGDGTYEYFYGATGLASAIITASQAYKAYVVASIVYKSWTRAADSQTASQLCSIDNLPLFTNGTDSNKHLSNPNNPASATFETLFAPGVTNRVGFSGGSFDSTWLGKMLLAATQVPHPSLPNATMDLEVTDIVGPTWMKIPFWQAAVQNLRLDVTSGGAAAATTNIFSADTVEKMGADRFIGAGGVAPYTCWTTSLLDNHPYSLAHTTDGPGGGPAHWCIAIMNQRPGVQNWIELAARDRDFTPFVHLYGPGDPTAQSERMVRMLADLDAGGEPGLPHFAMMFLGV